MSSQKLLLGPRIMEVCQPHVVAHFQGGNSCSRLHVWGMVVKSISNLFMCDFSVCF